MNSFIYLTFIILSLFSGPAMTLVLSNISCEFYNATCIKEAVASNNTENVQECYGTKVCPSTSSSSSCFAVWSNTSAADEYQDHLADIWQPHLHKTGLSVKMMGCFASTEGCNPDPECLADSNNPASRGGHLFCCCLGNMCNAQFEWVPKVTTEAPNSVVESSEQISPVAESSLLPVMYTILPLVAVCVAIGAIFFVIRQRKAARYAQTGINSDESVVLVDESNPNCVSQLANMQQRNIELMEIKARGRFGAVWKGKFGYDLVAVKTFQLQDKNSWYAEQEIYNLPQMSHDNVLKFVGVEKRGENLEMEFWLITSFHEKGSLCDFLKSNTVTWDELCKIAYSMARGLAHLHEELPRTSREDMKPAIAHRDFKSKNVLIKSDMTACIADFGLALVFEPGKAVGDAHGQVGTRRYMAPEVLEGAINFSKDAFLRIDVYACGLVLWELATRCRLDNQQNKIEDYKLPFEAEVTSPTLEQMQDLVVNKKCRPKLKTSWQVQPGMAAFCNTIEECWDHDAEARLSSSCILERIRNLQQFSSSRVGGVFEEQHLNSLNEADITSSGPDITEMTPLYIQVPPMSSTLAGSTGNSLASSDNTNV